MDDLTLELESLQISHDVDHIDDLIFRMEKSSYISKTIRNRVADLIRRELKSSSVDLAELNMLQRHFSQSNVTYIPRQTVRSAITHLRTIKGKNIKSNACNADFAEWGREQWYSYLVDSGTIISTLRNVFDELGICRYYSLPSRFTIVLYGNSEEDEFFETLLSRAETNLCDIPKATAKTIFKYYGGVKIEGSLDCL